MKLRLAFLLVSGLLKAGPAFAAAMNQESAALLSSGFGPIECQVACLNVCGRGEFKNELVSLQNASGFAQKAEDALAVAKALCQNQSTGQCDLGTQSTPVSLIVTTRDGYELAMRHNRATGYAGLFLKVSPKALTSAELCVKK